MTTHTLRALSAVSLGGLKCPLLKQFPISKGSLEEIKGYQVWWHKPAILAFEMLRQEDC